MLLSSADKDRAPAMIVSRISVVQICCEKCANNSTWLAAGLTLTGHGVAEVCTKPEFATDSSLEEAGFEPPVAYGTSPSDTAASCTAPIHSSGLNTRSRRRGDVVGFSPMKPLTAAPERSPSSPAHHRKHRSVSGSLSPE